MKKIILFVLFNPFFIFGQSTGNPKIDSSSLFFLKALEYNKRQNTEKTISMLKKSAETFGVSYWSDSLTVYVKRLMNTKDNNILIKNTQYILYEFSVALSGAYYDPSVIDFKHLESKKFDMYAEEILIEILKKDSSVVEKLVNLYDNRAYLYQAEFDYNQADYYYNKSIQLLEKYKNYLGNDVFSGRIGGLYMSYATLHNDFKKYTQSITYYTKALIYYKNKRIESLILRKIGDNYKQTKQYLKAVEFYKKELNLRESYWVYYSFPEKKTIKQDIAYDEKLATKTVYQIQIPKVEHWSTIEQYRKIADEYESIGELDSAILYYQKCNLFNENFLKGFHFLQNEYDFIIISAYNDLRIGRIYRKQHQTIKSIKIIEKSKRIYEKSGKPNIDAPDFSFMFYELALLSIQLANYPKSIKYLNKSIAIEELLIQEYQNNISQTEETAADLISELTKMYLTYFSISTMQEEYAVSYNHLLKVKGFLLNMANEKQTLRDSAIYETYITTAYELQKNLLISTDVEVQKLEKKLVLLEHQLSQQSTTFRDRNKWWQITYLDIQKNLKNHEAAIEIINFPDATDTAKTHYAALILTKNSKAPKMVMLPTNGKEMDGKYWTNYDGEVRNNRDDLSEAYQIYWQPIADALGSAVKTVWFSPDGVYHKISMDILGKSGARISDKWTLRTVASTRTLTQREAADAKIPQKGSAVLFGNPAFYAKIDTAKNNAIALKNNTVSSNTTVFYTAKIDTIKNLLALVGKRGLDSLRSGLAPLPGAEAEVQGIDNMFLKKGWQRNTYLGAAATEAQMRAVSRPTVLHIATHAGFSEAKNAVNDGLQQSRLFLAGAQAWLNTSEKDRSTNAEGVLTGSEAALLNLENTELVVLSACETGRGTLMNAEGVYGLQRAFKMAGAKAVLMSLWKIDDDATKEFMTAFYAAYINGKTKHEALVAAQNDLKAKNYDIKDWGAFVLLE